MQYVEEVVGWTGRSQVCLWLDWTEEDGPIGVIGLLAAAIPDGVPAEVVPHYLTAFPCYYGLVPERLLAAQQSLRTALTTPGATPYGVARGWIAQATRLGWWQPRQRAVAMASLPTTPAWRWPWGVGGGMFAAHWDEAMEKAMRHRRPRGAVQDRRTGRWFLTRESCTAYRQAYERGEVPAIEPL